MIAMIVMIVMVVMTMKELSEGPALLEAGRAESLQKQRACSWSKEKNNDKITNNMYTYMYVYICIYT